MNSFVALDFETANKYRSSVCSIGLVFVENNEIVPDYRGGREVLRAGSSDGGELGQEMEEGPPGGCRRGGILRAVFLTRRKY